MKVIPSTCALLLLAASNPASLAQETSFSVVDAFPELPSFDRPVDLQFAPGYDNRLFLVEQPGRIYSLVNSASTSEADLFLDITDRVLIGWEEGLLGLAFSPDFEESGHLFVYYTAHPAGPGLSHRSVLARFTASFDSVLSADPGSETVVLEFEQLGAAHNGGQVAFGPDGYLYVSIGDGKYGGDPFLAGQDPSNLFGSVIRIDVLGPSSDGSSGTAYQVPPTNPFVGVPGYRPEIWAYGLRNPWRFSFDFETGLLWLGDVGEGWIEQVNVIVKGGNYGWSTMEGSQCFNEPPEGAPACNSPELLLPVWEYTHANGDKSITGGFVYRGTALPELVGQYVYGDFISGRIFALEVDWGPDNDQPPSVWNSLLVESGLLITSFGVDATGELYLLDYQGRIHRLSGALDAGPDHQSPVAGWLQLAGPNPVRNETQLHFGVWDGAEIHLDLYDLQGRRVRHLYSGWAAPGGAEWVRVDTSGLAAGLYIARLHVAGRPAATTALTVVR